jgi:hypothetical protein
MRPTTLGNENMSKPKKDDRFAYVMRREDGHSHYAIGSALVLQQRQEDHAEIKITTLQVRRVVPAGSPEELQIEIGIEKIYKATNRSASQHCSFICEPAVADLLASACKDIWEKEPSRG